MAYSNLSLNNKNKKNQFEFNTNYEFTFNPTTQTTPTQTQTTTPTSSLNTGTKSTSKSETSERMKQQARVAERKAQNKVDDISSHTYKTQEKRALSEFSVGLSKSKRYSQLASNLSTLSSSRIQNADDKDAGFGIANGIIGALGIVVGAIAGGGAGATLGGTIATGVNGVVNLFNTSYKDREKAQLYANMQNELLGYLSNLTNRDTTIMNTMDQIYSSMDNLRGSYGSQFVDTMYNFYLAQSGMTSDAYSLLTGNFETFEDIGYGSVSAENGVFDTLTDGNQALFNNIYAQITAEDITGNQNLLDTMVQSLYGANTEMALQLREYENDLRNALKGTFNQQKQMVGQARNELAVSNADARSEGISAAEQIAQAEAESASSGLRGGTTGNNAALARLSRDLGQIQRTASTAALIGTLKYNIMNAQENASATAYAYRNAQKKAVLGAINSSVQSFNSIGRSAKGAERSANYYLNESQNYEKQFRSDFENVAEKDKDKIMQVT